MAYKFSLKFNDWMEKNFIMRNEPIDHSSLATKQFKGMTKIRVFKVLIF